MTDIQKILSLLFRLSYRSQDHFVNKNQNEVDRFVFCSLEKLNKVSLAFLRLHHQIDDSEDIEFSLGILARSVLMDMILVMEVKNVYKEFTGDSLDELKEQVRESCYKLINDGTNHLIEEIYSSDSLTDEEKSEKSKLFTSIFAKAFDETNGKAKLKKEFRFKLATIAEASKRHNLAFAEPILNLYSYYSKYDHLSHWTSLTSHAPLDIKKGKLGLAIILMTSHLRDLYVIAMDYDDNYKVLQPLVEEIENELNQVTEDSLLS